MTYYGFPTVNASNYLLKYPNDDERTWHNVFISEGSYEIQDMNKAIEQQLKQKNHYDSLNNKAFITLSSSISILKSVMKITGSHKLDFRPSNSVRSILGFKNKIHHAGYNESENIVNILTVNSILVEIDIINGRYVNGKLDPVIHSFILPQCFTRVKDS